MQTRYFATFGAEQLQDYEVIGGPASVMLLSPVGFTEEEFRAVLQVRFANKYCTTYPLEAGLTFEQDYGMRRYSMEDLEARKL